MLFEEVKGHNSTNALSTDADSQLALNLPTEATVGVLWIKRITSNLKLSRFQEAVDGNVGWVNILDVEEGRISNGSFRSGDF